MLIETAREKYEINKDIREFLASDIKVGPYWVVDLPLFPRIPKPFWAMSIFPLRG